MKGIFFKFSQTVVRCFQGYNLLVHLIAIVLTFILVTSGFDGWYFVATHNPTLQSWLFPAAIIGGLLPILLPIILLIVGRIKKQPSLIQTGYAVAQAAIIGWLVSSAYKAFTGRAHPIHSGINLMDVSHEFHFGFWQGGIFWGWPSSHTTVAFAVAVALYVLYSKNTFVKYIALIIALYIGIGVSTNIHWFSDFVAGALIGTVVGREVGKSFQARQL